MVKERGLDEPVQRPNCESSSLTSVILVNIVRMVENI